MAAVAANARTASRTATKRPRRRSRRRPSTSSRCPTRSTWYVPVASAVEGEGPRARAAADEGHVTQTQATGYIDYDRLEENSKLFRPNLLICGASAYPREWDYKRLRAVRRAAASCETAAG